MSRDDIKKALSKKDIGILALNILEFLNDAFYTVPKGSTTEDVINGLSLKAFNLPDVVPIILDDFLLPPQLIENRSGLYKINNRGKEFIYMTKLANYTYEGVFDLLEIYGSDKTSTNQTNIKEISNLIFQLTNNGHLSSHLLSDQWTVTDTIGNFRYALAISNFITNGETKYPISICIQAPWGGGKTSIMRMVRRIIDQNSVKPEQEAKDNTIVKLRDLKNTLSKYIKNKTMFPKLENNPQSLIEGIDPRLTIWFNAWEYENTEQVWAGLADSIIKDVASRMNVIERKWYYLCLNLNLEDAKSVLKYITTFILRYIWKQSRPWLVFLLIGTGISISIAIMGWVGKIGFLLNLAFVTEVFSGVLAGMGGIKLLIEKEFLKNSNVEQSLIDLTKAPSYKESSGFIHKVVEDIHLVFRVIPKKFLPLVIFIDDLDRCSPSKIAEVLEGINLFLAGEFPNCIFVMGMDTELVAASMEVYHESMIKKIPAYSKNNLLGWRFMDKFIQLPIMIPKPNIENLERFISSILIEYSTKSEEIKKNSNRLPLDKIVSGTLHNNKSYFKKQGDPPETLSDSDLQFRSQVMASASQFSQNPREIKRFMNCLRFYRFLLSIQKDSAGTPSLEQVRRWIILLLKWPQVARWVCWGEYSNSNNGNKPDGGSRSRLLLLENAGKSSSQEKWNQYLKDNLGIIEGKESLWFDDVGLRLFFTLENTAYNDSPLSKGAGAGIY